MVKKTKKPIIIPRKRRQKSLIKRINPTLLAAMVILMGISSILTFNLFQERLDDVLGMSALDYAQLESSGSAALKGANGTVCAGKNVEMKRLLLTSWCGKTAMVTCPEQGRVKVDLSQLTSQQRTLINPNKKRCLSQSEWNTASAKLCLCGLSSYPTARMVLRSSESDDSRGVAAVEFRVSAIENIEELTPFQFRAEVTGLPVNQKYVALACAKKDTSINLFLPENCVILDETYTSNKRGSLSVQSDLFGGLAVDVSSPDVGVLVCPKSSSDFDTVSCLYGKDPLKISAGRMKSGSSSPQYDSSTRVGGSLPAESALPKPLFRSRSADSTPDSSIQVQ